MSMWDIYNNRISAHGGNKYGATLLRESRMLTTKLPDSLSYHSVTIDDTPQNVAIINSDNLNEKYIYSLPGEDVKHGGLVEWKDNHWLITERDANNTVYVRGKMVQCNHLLHWIDKNGVIKEQWCIIEDGTKLACANIVNAAHFIKRRNIRHIIVWFTGNGVQKRFP